MDRDNQSDRMKKKATEFNSSPESSEDSFEKDPIEKLRMEYQLRIARVFQRGFGDRYGHVSSFNDSASSSSSNQVPALSFHRPNIGVETDMMGKSSNENQPSFPNNYLQHSFDDRYARVSSFNDSASSSSSIHLGALSLTDTLNRLGDKIYKPEQRTISGEYSFDRAPGPSRKSSQTRQTLTIDNMISSQPKNPKNYEGTPNNIQNIFSSVIHRVVELSLNPYEYQTVTNLLNVCTPQQRWQIVSEITAYPRQLLIMCLDTLGNSVVKKLIETSKDCKSVLPLIRALKPEVVQLINHVNGKSVIQSCLKNFSRRVNQFIFEAAITHCYEISTHKHGCHVMQSIIGDSDGDQQQVLLQKISELAYTLALDPYGNYIVKSVINRKIRSENAVLMSYLNGHFVSLSTSKYASHVVEDCISKIPESRRIIAHELLNTDDDDFVGLLRHSFVNYVVQSALSKKEGNDLHGLLVQRVRDHIHTLKGTHHYKKMLALVM